MRQTTVCFIMIICGKTDSCSGCLKTSYGSFQKIIYIFAKDHMHFRQECMQSFFRTKQAGFRRGYSGYAKRRGRMKL